MNLRKLNEELDKLLINEVSDEWKQQKRTNFINNKINPSQEYLKDVNNRINSYGKQSYTDRDYNTVKRLEKDRDREAQNLKYFNTKLKSFDRGQELHNNKPIPEKTLTDLFGEDLTGKIYEGNINCSGMGLTSLKGCPEVVNGYFNCSNNHLTSLEYAPEEVSGYFDCSNNNIKTLSAEDFPKVNGIVYSDFEEFNGISGKRLR